MSRELEDMSEGLDFARGVWTPAPGRVRIDVVKDPFVERAIAAMKADPARRWTVAALAREVGLSRAAFARRFTRSLGVPPLHWLAEHRLERARQLLVDTDLGLAAIAGAVGYATEFAFAKAFKRLLGIAPGRFRRSLPRAVDTFRAAA